MRGKKFNNLTLFKIIELKVIKVIITKTYQVMKKFLFYLMSILMTYIFFVITSLFIYFFYSIQKEIFYKKNLSAYEVYKNFQKTNEKVFFKIPSNLHLNQLKQFYPLSGIKNSFTINCNEMGYWSTYYADRYGFNNSDNIYNENITNLLFGDSFVHGSCVNENELMSYHLNQQGFKTLNYGYSGNGPISNLATYVEFGSKITSARNIFFFIYENDYVDFYEEKKNKILVNYLLDKSFTQNLIKNDKKVSLIKENLFNIELNKVKNKENYNNPSAKKTPFSKEVKDSFKLIQIRKLINSKIKTIKVKKTEKIYSDEDISNIINVIDILNLVKKKDQKLIIVYLPEYFNLFNSQKKITSEKYYNEILLFKKLKKRNLDFINIKEVFLNSKHSYKKMYAFEGYSHFSPLGYKTVAYEIINYLKDN